MKTDIAKKYWLAWTPIQSAGLPKELAEQLSILFQMLPALWLDILWL